MARFRENPVRIIILASIILSTAALFFIRHYKQAKEPVIYKKMLMGTLVEITLYEGQRKDFDKAAESAFDEIKRLEALLSSYKPNSDVSIVSANAGNGPIKVSPETIQVVQTALHISELSGGAFDPTIGVLAKAWGFSGENKRVPKQDEIKTLLLLVDYKRVIIDPEKNLLGLEKKGMVLNLGGVAKGYIVGKARDKLKENGVTGAIIKAGGDMFLLRDEAQKPFRIGIQDPRDPEKLLGELFVRNGAVATSGDYERFFMMDDIRYHHILDPETGFPARRSMAATVVTKDPVLADALSTAVFVLGPQKGFELIKNLDGVEGLIVGADGEIKVSAGFPGKLLEEKVAG